MTLVVTLVAAAPLARASPPPEPGTVPITPRRNPSGGPLALGVITAWGLEVLVPDLRYEQRVDGAGGDDGWVVSWPVHLVEWRPDRRVWMSAFVEPQLRTTGGNQWRALAGGRLNAVPFSRARGSGLPGLPGVLIEAGGVVGQDGHGAMVGAGIVWDVFNLTAQDEDLAPTVAFVYRRVFTDEGDRAELSVDVVLFSFDTILSL